MEEAEILSRMKSYVSEHDGPAAPDLAATGSHATSHSQLDTSRLDAAVASLWSSKERVALLNPRNPGLLNDLAQRVKKLMKRSLGWYTRSLQEFHAQVAYALQEETGAIKALDASLRNLEREVSEFRTQMLAVARAPQETHFESEGSLKEQRRLYVELFRGTSEVLDINCGNGELLELLRAGGISAYGVSQARNAREIARRKSLKIVNADIFEHLNGMPERSLGGAFSAGFLERLPTRLQAEFLRLLSGKLRPGAVTVIETVSPVAGPGGDISGELFNPETIAPDLLKTLLEAHNFRDIRVFSLAAIECQLTTGSDPVNNGSSHGSVLEPRGQCSPTSIYSVIAYRS